MVNLKNKFAIIPMFAIMFMNAPLMELRSKIVIVDTGIAASFDKSALCEEGHTDYTGYGLVDVHGHGTKVATLIASGMDKSRQCIVVVKWWHDASQKINQDRLVNIMTYVKSLHPRWVNLSMSGKWYDKQEEKLFQEMVDENTIITVAAGNDGKNLDKVCDVFPACYNVMSDHWIVVGNGHDETIAGTSNYGGPVRHFINGEGSEWRGTSRAAAEWLKQLLRVENGRD